MARTLKLDCITLRIYRKGTEDILPFDEFFRYKQANGSVISRPFADFFSKYLESFNGAFAVMGGASKSIYLNSKSVKAKLKNRTIYGLVEGGNSGSRVDVQDTSKAGEVLFPILPNHVGSEPFHFLLWVPANFEVGILLLQGYSNASIADAFKQHLARFFRRECPDATLSTGAYVGPMALSRFQGESIVDKITVRRTQLASDVAEHLLKGIQLESGNSKLTVELKISGLNKLQGFDETLKTWFANGAQLGGLIDIEELGHVGLDEDPETIIGYKDAQGRQVSSSKRRDFEVKPVLYIDSKEVSIGEDGRPDAKEMRKFMEQELERIQLEIGYTTTTSS